jgi:hypothetical protein
VKKYRMACIDVDHSSLEIHDAFLSDWADRSGRCQVRSYWHSISSSWSIVDVEMIPRPFLLFISLAISLSSISAPALNACRLH